MHQHLLKTRRPQVYLADVCILRVCSIQQYLKVSTMNSIDKKQTITNIMDHVCRDFTIYVDQLFKPIVLFQDMDREQEHASHTADTMDDCSQLLTNSLAGNRKYYCECYFYFVLEQDVSLWLNYTICTSRNFKL